MANMSEYIKWRGDLSFEQDALNEVDNMILAYLSYVNLDGIPEIQDEQGLPVGQLSDRFFSIHTQEELDADKSFIRMAPYLMKEMAVSRRFGKSVVRNYVNEIVTTKNLQFSALEILLEDGSSYIAFRGTDDTIVGWKEDFNLSNGIVPAQQKAVAYVNRICSKNVKGFRLGGHSKGGNLALYAAVKCQPEVQKHMLAVYDNDGPGFISGIFREDEIQKIRERAVRIIPEYSVIGMLLEQMIEPRIVTSTQKGLLQHDGFSWNVEGPAFLHAETISESAALFNDTLHKWIDDMDVLQREHLINDLFSVLEATGVQTLTEVQDGGIKSLVAMMKQAEKLNPQSKTIVIELIKGLFAHWLDFMKLSAKGVPVLDKLPFLS